MSGTAHDSDGESFLKEIAEQMAARYKISEIDAISRVRRHLIGRPIVGNHMIYHEAPDFWAQAIFTGRRDFWRDQGDTCS